MFFTNLKQKQSLCLHQYVYDIFQKYSIFGWFITFLMSKAFFSSLCNTDNYFLRAKTNSLFAGLKPPLLFSLHVLNYMCIYIMLCFLVEEWTNTLLVENMPLLRNITWEICHISDKTGKYSANFLWLNTINKNNLSGFLISWVRS